MWLCLGQSFKPVKVTDNDESSFKVSEDPIKDKHNRKGLEQTKGNSPPAITTSKQSIKPGLATLPEVNRTENTKMQTTSIVHIPSHIAGSQTGPVIPNPNPMVHVTGNTKMQYTSPVDTASQNAGSQTIPVFYRIQNHVKNLTHPKNNFHDIGLPVRLHVHPNLPLPEIGDTAKTAASLSRQQTSDLHGNKASSIRGTFEWGAFSKCSVTCGEGVRKRYRRCSVQECTAPGIETQVVPCTSSECSGMIYSFNEHIFF